MEMGLSSGGTSLLGARSRDAQESDGEKGPGA